MVTARKLLRAHHGHEGQGGEFDPTSSSLLGTRGTKNGKQRYFVKVFSRYRFLPICDKILKN
jgi:hypothetical protein